MLLTVWLMRVFLLIDVNSALWKPTQCFHIHIIHRMLCYGNGSSKICSLHLYKRKRKILAAHNHWILTIFAGFIIEANATNALRTDFHEYVCYVSTFKLHFHERNILISGSYKGK